MAFDYSQPDVPASAVADVVAEITSYGKLPPLSDEERETRRIERELYRWQCQQREEERAFEYRERQAEAEAIARAEHAAEIAGANRKRTLERQEQISRQAQERQLRDLHYKTRQQELWQQNVDRAAYNALAQRYRHTLMGQLDAMIAANNSRQQLPPPEPEVVEQPTEDTGRLDYPKLHRWF
jgi:hypothetical protein